MKHKYYLILLLIPFFLSGIKSQENFPFAFQASVKLVTENDSVIANAIVILKPVNYPNAADTVITNQDGLAFFYYTLTSILETDVGTQNNMVTNNPGTDHTFVIPVNINNGNYQSKVLDVNGKVVTNIKGYVQDGNYYCYFDGEQYDLQQGIYVHLVNNGKYFVSQKFVQLNDKKSGELGSISENLNQNNHYYSHTLLKNVINGSEPFEISIKLTDSVIYQFSSQIFMEDVFQGDNNIFQYQIEIDDAIYSYKWSGIGIDTIYIKDNQDTLLGFAIPLVDSIWSFTYLSVMDELSNIKFSSDKANHISRDTIIAKSRPLPNTHENIDLVLEEIIQEKDNFSIFGSSTPTNAQLIAIATDGIQTDTIFNANTDATTGDYNSQIFQSYADSVSFIVKLSKDNYVSIDTTFKKAKGNNEVNFVMNKEAPVNYGDAYGLARFEGGSSIFDAIVQYKQLADTNIKAQFSTVATGEYLLQNLEVNGSSEKYIITVSQGASCSHTFPNFVDTVDVLANQMITKNLNVQGYAQVEDINCFVFDAQGNSANQGIARLIDADADTTFAEGSVDENGKVTFDNVPANKNYKIRAGSLDTTLFAWETPYSTPSEITKLDQEVNAYFWLESHKQRIPGENSGTSADSVYVRYIMEYDSLGIPTEPGLLNHSGGALNVSYMMGKPIPVYFKIGVIQNGGFSEAKIDSIMSHIREGERKFANGKEIFVRTMKPVNYHIPFDPYTDTTHIDSLGVNAARGVANTVTITKFASNGDGIAISSHLTVNGGRTGDIKEFLIRVMDMESYPGSFYFTNTNRASWKLVTDQQIRRYEVESNKNGLYGDDAFTPLPKYVQENYFK